MKRLIPPLCFAVTTAVAAELKDPAVVAREWQLSAELTLQPIGPAQNLAAPSDARPTPPLERLFGRTTLPLLPPSPVRLQLIDAPSYKIPDQLPSIRPYGAIPREYDGKVHWWVPLSTPAGK